jgi:HEAT repeat protein
MSAEQSTEQRLIQVLMRSAQTFLGTLERGNPDASANVRVRRTFELSFQPVWDRLDVLELSCSREGMRWQGRTVLSAEEDRHELVRTLLRSGIHGLTLVPGVEEEEASRALELVQRSRLLDEGGDQDLVTMLFRADLHHIRYMVGPPVDPLAPTATTDPDPGEPGRELPEAPGATDQAPNGAGPGTEAPTGKASRLEAAGAEGPLPPEVVRARIREDLVACATETLPTDPVAPFLEPDEVRYLTEALEQEFREDPARSVVALLLDTLQLQSDGQDRDHVIRVLRELLPYLLGTGRFAAVAYLTSELHGLARMPGLEARHKAALDDLRLALSESDALTQLFHVLEDARLEATAEELRPLLRALSRDAIRTVLVWIGQLAHPGSKAALIEALEAYFRESPATMSTMTSASDRTVVQRALGMVERLQLPAFAEAAAAAIRHTDPRTRRHAVRALAAIGTPDALRRIEPALTDPEAEVRIAAYETFAHRPFRWAAPRLAGALAREGLESTEVRERRALLSAYALAAGPAAVSAIEPILFGRGRLARRPSTETRACAAVALGLLRTPAARSVLERARSDRDPVVRSAATTALRAEQAS